MAAGGGARGGAWGSERPGVVNGCQERLGAEAASRGTARIPTSRQLMAGRSVQHPAEAQGAKQGLSSMAALLRRGSGGRVRSMCAFWEGGWLAGAGAGAGAGGWGLLGRPHAAVTDPGAPAKAKGPAFARSTTPLGGQVGVGRSQETVAIMIPYKYHPRTIWGLSWLGSCSPSHLPRQKGLCPLYREAQMCVCHPNTIAVATPCRCSTTVRPSSRA